MTDPEEIEARGDTGVYGSRSVLGVLAAFFAVYALKGIVDPTVHLADFFAHLGMAAAIGEGPVERLASPGFPIGYPFLLKMAMTVLPQPVLAAHLMSASFAVLALWGVFRVAANLTGVTGLALLTTVCTALSPPFLEWASAEGSDMPFVAMLLLSVALLSGSVPRVFAAGLAAGLMHDFRYAATAPLAALIAWLAVFGAPGAERRDRFRHLGEFLVGALLSASPQLLVTCWVHGTPVRTVMAKNVWFGIYGANNWQNNWGRVPDDIGLLEVIRLGPMRFWTHWAGNLGGLAVGALAFPARVLGHIVNLLLPFGAIHVLWRLKQPAVGFWYWVTGVYTAALALVFLGSRYNLPVVPALALASCWFLWDFLPIQATFGGRAVRVRMLGVALLLALKVPLDLIPAFELSPTTKTILAVDAALRRAGMTRASEVLATSSDHYEVKTLARFTRWESDAPEPVKNLESLGEMMRRRGYRFLVYDREYGVEKVLPQLAVLLEPAKVPSGLFECVLPPTGPTNAVVYRLVGASPTR